MITNTVPAKPQIAFKGHVHYSGSSYENITSILAGKDPYNIQIEEVRAFNEAVLKFQNNTPDSDVIGFSNTEGLNQDGTKDVWFSYNKNSPLLFGERPTKNIPGFKELKTIIDKITEFSMEKQNHLQQIKK
jgi:hypothetical protein